MTLEPLSPATLAVALAANLLLGGLAYARGSVSRGGFVAGVGVGTLLFVFGGLAAFLALLGFFVLGTAATKLGWSRKAASGLQQEDEGARGAPHALANCGTGLALALTMPFVEHPALGVALFAAFATAASDTLGSEIGQLYGRTPFLPTTFRRVPPGTEGAVSAEGTLAGVVGSLLLGLVGLAAGLYGLFGLLAVVLGAFVGTTVESYVGAVWGQDARIGNEAMNFLNTVVGAGVAGLLFLLMA